MTEFASPSVHPYTCAALADPDKLPGCIFAPTNVSPRSLFAKDASGALVHVSQVETGAKGLICPECETTLVARKGAKNAHHFAHTSGEDCLNVGETALHRLAKEIIARGGPLRLPAVMGAGEHGLVTLRGCTFTTFDRVEIEPWEQGYRPDLVGYKTEIEGGLPVARRLLIEIRVTHAVEPKKVKDLRERGESVLEIDLSRIREPLGYTELARQILSDANRTWLTHPAIEDHARAKIEQAAETERQRERQRLEQEAEAARRRERQRLQEAETDRQRERHRSEQEAAAARRRELERRDYHVARERARGEPPRPTEAAARMEAEAERNRWLAVGASDPLSLQADDTFFAVEPLLWRTEVLKDLAPWRSQPAVVSGARTPAATPYGLEWFRVRGFIKRAFLAEAVPSGEEGTFAAEISVSQQLTEFRQAFLVACYPPAGRRPWTRAGTTSQALFVDRWRDLEMVRRLLLHAMKFLGGFEVELRVTVGTGQAEGPSEPRRLGTEADVDALLATGWLQSQPTVVRALGPLMNAHLTQWTIPLIQALADGLAQHGLAVAQSAHASRPTTFELLRHILIDRDAGRGQSARPARTATSTRASPRAPIRPRTSWRRF